ncbi:MAG TPA: LysR family transcriptional regulator, partial [Myxococcaceae bacterium]|nr:LysR family transcriptional regulator [Myxococcaceae bacterium]
MTPVHTVDLNLLRVLDVLLEEENVTRAAGRLRLTQSAVSRSLARLRRLFGDDLLLRTGRGMRPTSRAL